MAESHFNRGGDFDCPVGIFEFVYSDWEAADRVTGGHWNVKTSERGFKGRWGGFWAEFKLLNRDHCTGTKDGRFTYMVTLGGKGKCINGSGILTLTYYKKHDNTVKADGTVDLRVTGLMSPLWPLFEGKLNRLTNKLVDYQQRACTTIANDPEGVMGLLSKEQQFELRKSLKMVRDEDIFEASLDIEQIDGKYQLRFSSPLKRVRHEIEENGKATEMLKQFEKLIETANQCCSDLRSAGSRDVVKDESRNFLQEIRGLGIQLFKTYLLKNQISGDVRNSGQSIFSLLQFSAHHKSSIRTRISTEGRIYSAIPWELMHDGDDFLCIKTGTFRVARESEASKIPERKSRIKGVLIVISNPGNDLEDALVEGKNILYSIRNSCDVHVKLLSGKEATIENVVREIGSGKYQILHYSGHSKFEEKATGSSYLLMECGKRLLADDLSRISKRSSLRLVFLNSCSSGSEKVDIYKVRGLASAFINSGVPYVIGMNWDVTDSGATLLSGEFYKEYIITNDPIEALRKAREFVGIATEWEDPAWSAPIIYAV